jgi:hypothetical protein
VTYPYSARNLLVEPHHYMYAPFEGMPLLESFIEARQEVLQHQGAVTEPLIPVANRIDRNLALRSPETQAMWRESLAEPSLFAHGRGDSPAAAASVASLSSFSIESEITTSSLLESLLADLVSDDAATRRAQPIKEWIDRVCQRFEVTKRLYAFYLPGFRKGSGEYQSIHRYWLFALILGLSLSQMRGLKHLNALLKVCDLLCSLSARELADDVPAGGMRIVLAVEHACIGALMKDGGLLHASV